jgi:hypothetical protein
VITFIPWGTVRVEPSKAAHVGPGAVADSVEADGFKLRHVDLNKVIDVAQSRVQTTLRSDE